jgi:hypothetical protein
MSLIGRVPRFDPCGSGRRDTVPAALHYSSTTQEDSRGLVGTYEDNKLTPNPFSLFELAAKVARHHHLSKREGSGSTPAASTNLNYLFSIFYRGRGNLSRVHPPFSGPSSRCRRSHA